MISIIVPAYNAAKYLAATVDSVLAQTVEDWELVIVDDGSQDDTAAIATTYVGKDRRIRLLQKENGGQAKARNFGYAAASPDSAFAVFLDADDVWLPDALQTLLVMLEKDCEATAAHGLADYISDTGQPTDSPIAIQVAERLTVSRSGVTPRPAAGETAFATLIVHNCVPTPGAMLLRRDALPHQEVFDAQAVPNEDWDLWLRLTRHGRILFVDKPVIKYRVHADATSRNRQIMLDAQSYVLHKVATSTEFYPKHRRLLRLVRAFQSREIAKKRLELAKQCLHDRNYVQAARHICHVIINTSIYVNCLVK